MTLQTLNVVTHSFEIPPGEGIPEFDEKPNSTAVPEGKSAALFRDSQYSPANLPFHLCVLPFLNNGPKGDKYCRSVRMFIF